MSFLSRSAFAVLAALAVLSAASAGVNTPQSGWYSGNPLLGPNTLRDVACSGSTCYAAGHFGTLLKSTDAGATWSGTVTGLTADFSRVRLAGGSPQHVIVGGDCVLRRSDDGGGTFFRLPFTARDTGCTAGLVSLSFPTDQVGYVLLADGRVLSTADGGRSFTGRTSLPGSSRDLVCTAERTCFAAVPQLGPTAGAIMRTDDGGTSWTRVAESSYLLDAVSRADGQTLFAVGFLGTVLKSVDGGTTWASTTIPDFLYYELTGISCGDALHCLITTRTQTPSPGPVYRTTDGGKTFTTVQPSNDATRAVTFANPTRTVAVGEHGSAEVSDDAGESWAPVGSRIAGTFRVLTATTPSVAYAGGADGVVVRTADAGRSWKSVNPPTGLGVASLGGFGADRLYVLAEDGSLLRSDNGGSSYRVLNPGAVHARAVAALDAYRVLLVGPRGLAKSRDAGESFRPIQSAVVRRAALSRIDFGAGVVAVFGTKIALVSPNGETGWKRVPIPGGRAIRDLDFTSISAGYVLDSRGALWRTRNAGRRWTKLTSLGTSTGYRLDFPNPRDGYLAVRWFGSVAGGYLLRTLDGGSTWHPQLVGPAPLASLESFNLDRVEYALAEDDALYGTDRGGDVGSPSTLAISAQPRSLRRAGPAVVVSGRLSPADGGEEIVVSQLVDGRWSQRLATSAANGTFATRWRPRRNAVYVAQVLGDASHVGAGTAALTVRVGR